MQENKSPKFHKGVCWFCKTSCDLIRYTHEDCIVIYFKKPAQPRLVEI